MYILGSDISSGSSVNGPLLLSGFRSTRSFGTCEMAHCSPTVTETCWSSTLRHGHPDLQLASLDLIWNLFLEPSQALALRGLVHLAQLVLVYRGLIF